MRNETKRNETERNSILLLLIIDFDFFLLSHCRCRRRWPNLYVFSLLVYAIPNTQSYTHIKNL
jgi:hypothetical protein